LEYFTEIAMLELEAVIKMIISQFEPETVSVVAANMVCFSYEDSTVSLFMADYGTLDNRSSVH
jgi:hypothetical protein